MKVERPVLVNGIHLGCDTGLGNENNYSVNNRRDIIYKIMQTSMHFASEELRFMDYVLFIYILYWCTTQLLKRIPNF